MIYSIILIKTGGYHIENIGVSDINFEIDYLNGRGEKLLENIMKRRGRQRKSSNKFKKTQ